MASYSIWFSGLAGVKGDGFGFLRGGSSCDGGGNGGGRRGGALSLSVISVLELCGDLCRLTGGGGLCGGCILR
jgi:hypothetical protein